MLIASGDDLYWKDYIFRNALSEGRYPYNATDVYASGYQGKAYPLKSLMVIESDPLRELPGSLKGEMGLQKLPFLVVVSPFSNETTRYADIVLPSTISPESANLVSCHRPLSSQYLRLRKKAIAPQGESISSHTIICNLAYMMGVGKLFDFTESTFANMIFKSSPFTRTLSCQNLETAPLPLAPLYQVRELFPHPYRKSFDTPSGKVLFASKPLAQLGFNPYPEWYPPLESKLQTPAFFSKYPFTLVSAPTVRNRISPGVDEVLINTQDARDQGIQEGMDVWIESKINKVKRKVVISEDIAQGVVSVVQSLSALIPGSTGKVQSINRLIDDQNNDPIAGAPRFNEMLVKIYPA